MNKHVTRHVLAALPILVVASFDAPPVLACNIANPPVACANVPGSNPVAGLGTLHRNQFQGVPGSQPALLDRPSQFGGISSPGTDENGLYPVDLGGQGFRDSAAANDQQRRAIEDYENTLEFGSDEEIEAAAKFLRRSGLVSQQSLDQKRVPFLAGEDVVDVEQQHDSIMDDLDFFFVRM